MLVFGRSMFACQVPAYRHRSSLARDTDGGMRRSHGKTRTQRAREQIAALTFGTGRELCLMRRSNNDNNTSRRRFRAKPTERLHFSRDLQQAFETRFGRTPNVIT
jgi:hypothetical protein